MNQIVPNDANGILELLLFVWLDCECGYCIALGSSLENCAGPQYPTGEDQYQYSPATSHKRRNSLMRHVVIMVIYQHCLLNMLVLKMYIVDA
jgi:hypothetical protein